MPSLLKRLKLCALTPPNNASTAQRGESSGVKGPIKERRSTPTWSTHTQVRLCTSHVPFSLRSRARLTPNTGTGPLSLSLSPSLSLTHTHTHTHRRARAKRVSFIQILENERLKFGIFAGLCRCWRLQCHLPPFLTQPYSQTVSKEMFGKRLRDWGVEHMGFSERIDTTLN